MVVLEIDPAVKPEHKNTLISMAEGLVQESISHQLRRALREFFGFDRFKGQQEAIIESICEGQDTFVIMPTGAGKSLCYQLPAVISPGTAIIISPLIALMKNQVDAVRAFSGTDGIAEFLNSSLTKAELKRVRANVDAGITKMLYVAPESLVKQENLDFLHDHQISFVAVDEAHCISEWGHDFRPEYRNIRQMVKAIGDVPLIALTATATEKVQNDIIKNLQMTNARLFKSSFNRPNLFYEMRPKVDAVKSIVRYIKENAGKSGIIYTLSRKKTEELAEILRANDIKAVPYHAGLESAQRVKNQDDFLMEEIDVIVATIAFGMGIDKPDVRFVIHYDIPKSIESYYQETGRAGRDGLPGDCILLFSAVDAAKQTHFIDEMSNPKEKQIARDQLNLMLRYAECPTCRRRELLNYFAENYSVPNCEACDNCIQPRETYDATTQAQKLLSCAYRVRQVGRFGVGLNHLIEILTGADTEKIRRWGHDQLTTYGIGKEFSRSEWSAIGRELLRAGLLAQDTGQFPTISLSPEGLDALKSRRVIVLTKTMAVKKVAAPRAGEIACDETLFDRLRKLRKKLADERAVPAYVIFGDNTLRHMAREYPTKVADLRFIEGISERKQSEFGDAFVAEVGNYLKTYPKVKFT